jgi:hypothetical protein
MESTRIPDEWHKEPAFNCLSDEDFKVLQDTYQVGVSLKVDECECGVFQLDGYHRCACGNRRCYLVCGECGGEKFFYVEVY